MASPAAAGSPSPKAASPAPPAAASPAPAATASPHPGTSLVHHHAEQNIQADSSDDSFSDYGTSLGSDTTSLRSSLLSFEFENGRRYQRLDVDRHLMPNDETEQDRLDLHHHIFTLLMDGEIHLAPLTSPHRVLDVGTGTGIWALQMAELYPAAEVLGTDVTPIQPSWTLPNCYFQIDDAEQDWTFQSDHFDMIHLRNLSQSIKNWPRLFEQSYRCTIPGGYLEFMEADTDLLSDDNSVPPESAIRRLIDAFNDGMASVGMKRHVRDDYLQMVIDAGYVDLEYRPFKQPFNSWPSEKKMKYVGRLNMVNIETALQAYSMAVLTRIKGMEISEATKLIEDALKDMQNRKMHGYNIVHHIVARKPLAKE